MSNRTPAPARFRHLGLATLLAATLPGPAAAAPLQLTSAIGANSFGASVSDDGQRVAFYSASNLTGQNADRNFEIFLYDRPTGALQQISNNTQGVGSGSQLPTISGDGSRIVFQSFETRGTTGFFQSRYHDVASNTQVEINALTSQFQLTDISRNGQVIALNVDNNGLQLFDTRNRTLGLVLAFNPASITMSGDAQQLATDQFRGGVSLIDVVSGGTRAVSPGGSGVNQRPDFSQDGSTIAFSSTFDPLGTNADHNQELFLYDVASRQYRQVTRTIGGQSSEASLSADGHRVAFTTTSDLLGGNADGNQEIFVYDLLEDRFTQITDTLGSFSLNPAISGDGLTLAFSSSADLAGDNPNRIPQIYLQDLAPRGNAVPEPASAALVLLALLAVPAMRARRIKA